MNPQTWVASGHLGGFSDPLMDCKECHERFRADQLIEEFAGDNDIELDGSVDGWSNEADGSSLSKNIKLHAQLVENTILRKSVSLT